MADEGSDKPKRRHRGRKPPTKAGRKNVRISPPPKELIEWLDRCLTALGHPDPTSLSACLVPDKKGDKELQLLVIWLEDRCVRQWDETDRVGLRKRFWATMPRYLDCLECPSEYFQGRWGDDQRQRIAVINWLVSCAISEVYGDSKDELNGTFQAKESEKDGTIEEVPPTTESGTASLDTASFPLGFTTNDEDVDHIVTALRMHYLLELRAEQDQVNECIAKMQNVTVSNESR
uniref:Uncharacterized protein n=1 Tax=Trieres chinensis TaxID=1514140 RepID=A0A7S1Z4D1_TRICV|mmetsp:Transcript_17352/g.35586  ORF Transcript_17352/g.35586 Transcript_17352/m.35586 type:complete len:233 (+) Transcript_17352:97-795(+)